MSILFKNIETKNTNTKKYKSTAEHAYSRLQGNKEYRLLKEKSTITGKGATR